MSLEIKQTAMQNNRKATVPDAKRAETEELISLLRRLDGQQQAGFLLMVQGAALLPLRKQQKLRP